MKNKKISKVVLSVLTSMSMLSSYSAMVFAENTTQGATSQVAHEYDLVKLDRNGDLIVNGSFDNNGGGNINFNQEAGTHNYFNRFFLAATKHLFFQNVGELGLHMAYIYSRATGLNYEGPALGVNFRCCLPDTSLGNKILNGLNLMAEYDARTINIGFNYAVWKDRFNLIAELNDGKYLSAGLYFKICLK